MWLTGVNGWFPRFSMFLAHTCSLTFYRAVTDNSQRVTCRSVTGSAFMHETTGKAHAYFVPPPRKRNAYPFAVHVRFGISRIPLCEHFQA